MNRTMAKAEGFLYFLGYLNVSLIVLSISFTLVNIFPEREGIFHIYNSYGVLPLLCILKPLAEKAGRKWAKAAVFAGVFMAIPLASGSVAATAWTLSLLIFVTPALFAPKFDNHAMMTRPRIWHALVFIVMYGVGEISQVYSVRAHALVFLFIFLFEFALEKNLTGCMRKIRESGENADAAGVMRANSRVILLYLLVFSLLALFLPTLISALSRERERSTVVYDFWEDGGEEEKETATPLTVRDKGLTVAAKEIDYSGVGNALLVLFLMALALFVFLEIYVVLKRIGESGKEGAEHKDSYKGEYSREEIAREEREEKRNASPFFSKEARIRRLYRRSVERRRKERDISSLTPGEIEKEFLVSPSASAMTEIYCRIRYSSRPATDGDLDKMKDAARDEKSSK